MTHDHILQTDRLALRTWSVKDIPGMAAISNDKEVMRYFPSVQSLAETTAFVERQIEMQTSKGYCYYAATLLATGQLIGFIGLSYQTYPSTFTPSVDIGWRLAAEHWGIGLATEGARAVLAYGHEQLAIQAIYAVAPLVNTSSIAIMKKIGMQFYTSFDHPYLTNCPTLESCVCYRSEKHKE